jgi:hypothetical protein
LSYPVATEIQFSLISSARSILRRRAHLLCNPAAVALGGTGHSEPHVVFFPRSRETFRIVAKILLHHAKKSVYYYGTLGSRINLTLAQVDTPLSAVETT